MATSGKTSTRNSNIKTKATEINYQQVQYITVDQQFANQRLDNHLIRTLKNLPKGKIYKIIRKGEVRVNKKRVKPEYNIQPGDLIRIPPLRLEKQPQVKSPTFVQQKIEDAIIHEDKNIIVINKPTAMAVHGGSGLSFGVIEALRNSRPQAKYLELVHRLDRITSGCLLIAKKRSTLKLLQSQFIEPGGITKKYYTLVAGTWPKKLTSITAPLLKNTLKSGERIVRIDESGKQAITKYKILQCGNNCTLVEVSPITGRTHQIRVHCQHAGYPIIGDDKYGSKQSNLLQKQLECKRLFLHASSIKFTAADGETLCFNAKLPDDLLQILDKAKITNPEAKLGEK